MTFALILFLLFSLFVFSQSEFDQMCICQTPCEDDCLNAAALVECDSNCPMGEKCGNQRFAKQQYPKLEVREVGEKEETKEE